MGRRNLSAQRWLHHMDPGLSTLVFLHFEDQKGMWTAHVGRSYRWEFL